MMHVPIDPIRYPAHRNCTWIMKARCYPSSPEKMLRERTHGCWCSSWRQRHDGAFLHWRKGKWLRPTKGDVRMTSKKPPI